MFVDQRYKSNRDREYSHLLDIVRKAGGGVAPQPAFQQPAFCEPPPVPADSRLLDLEGFFSSEHGIAPLVIDLDGNPIQQKLRTALADKTPRPTLTGTGFSGGETPYQNGVRMMGLPNQAVNQVGQLNFVFNEFGLGQTMPAILVPISITYSMGPIEKDRFPLEWLRSDKIGERLVDAKSGVVFPKLKTFWGRVGVMNVEGATLFLQQQLESITQGTISFFGIPVDRNLAISAGPIICFSLLFFFLLHLKQIRSTEIAASTTYPWIALFRGSGSALLTYITLVVLPGFANVLLLIRHGKLGELSTSIGGTAAAFVVVIGVATTVELYRLRTILAKGCAPNHNSNK